HRSEIHTVSLHDALPIWRGERRRDRMSAIENIAAEQLWYTWSDVGLSTIHAGFRIRAASPGLSEIYSERVKSMDRHMRYVLPPGDRKSTRLNSSHLGISY